MRKSINKMVGIRVATTVAAVLIYSFAVTANIFVIRYAEGQHRGDDIVGHD